MHGFLEIISSMIIILLLYFDHVHVKSLLILTSTCSSGTDMSDRMECVMLLFAGGHI